jgi:hypothetical protein
MNIERMRGELDRLYDTIDNAEGLLGKAKRQLLRLNAGLVPEPPVVEPGPTDDIGVTMPGGRGTLQVELADATRQSGGADLLGLAIEHRVFIEHFRTEAEDVTETIVILHNGNPEGRGAINIPHLTVKTHDGRTIFDGANVVIPPGGMFVVGDYGGASFIEGDAARLFWRNYNLVGYDPWADNALWPWLSKLDALYPKVNGVRMAWDPEGARGGGQGIEPYRFEWRKCPAGFALAMQELIGVANRTTRCMTDAEGRFAWDRTQPYTDVQEAFVNQWMPDAFKWNPHTKAEFARAEWKNIDGQHAIRAWSAAMFLARETKHPFALWFLEMYENWMDAVHLSDALDGDENPAWWSLFKKRNGALGPNEHCGRTLAHLLRFEGGLGWLNPARRATDTSRVMIDLLSRSFDANGNPHAAKAEIFSNENFDEWKQRDKNTRCTQGFEMQLMALALEDCGRRFENEAANLRAHLTDSPAYAYNLETGEKRGHAHPFFELSTHGKFDGDMDALRKISAGRIEAGGPEAGGANPINYLNPRRGIA